MADSKKYDGSQWEHSLRKLTTATEAVENPLYSDGTAITAYTLKGNTVQNGTPTPSNPVEVQGVGVRTENLFDERIQGAIIPSNGVIENNAVYDVAVIPVIAGEQYTFTYKQNYLQNYVIAYYTTKPVVGSTSYDSSRIVYYYSEYPTVTVTIPNGITYIAIRLPLNGDLMFNTGSTALPYEPYGYKIPISSAGQTIDIYIGDLPLLKSLDGTAVDEISNGTLTRRVDSDGSVLPAPTTKQITMPSMPTTEGANTISVDTTVQPSEFIATWTGWHNASVKEWGGSQWNE